jgi:hypothetical protein
MAKSTTPEQTQRIDKIMESAWNKRYEKNYKAVPNRKLATNLVKANKKKFQDYNRD